MSKLQSQLALVRGPDDGPVFQDATPAEPLSRGDYKRARVELRQELLELQQQLRELDHSQVILYFAGVDKAGKGETIIRRADIEYLEAARNYVTVSTGERDFLVRNTLAKLEQQLAPGQIVRTHRSYLVNIDKIAEIRSTETGGYEIHLYSGKTVPLSRGYRDGFRSMFAD